MTFVTSHNSEAPKSTHTDKKEIGDEKIGTCAITILQSVPSEQIRKLDVTNSVDFKNELELALKLQKAGLPNHRINEICRIISSHGKLKSWSIVEIMLGFGQPDDFINTNYFSFFQPAFNCISLEGFADYIPFCRAVDNQELADHLTSLREQLLSVPENPRMNNDLFTDILKLLNFSDPDIDHLWKFTEEIPNEMHVLPFVIGAAGNYFHVQQVFNWFQGHNMPYNDLFEGICLKNNIQLSEELIPNLSVKSESLLYLAFKHKNDKVMESFLETSQFPAYSSYSVQEIVKDYLDDKEKQREGYRIFLSTFLQNHGLNKEPIREILDQFFQNEEHFSEICPSYYFDPIALVAAFGKEENIDSLINSNALDIQNILSKPVSDYYNFAYFAIMFENLNVLVKLKNSGMDINETVDNITKMLCTYSIAGLPNDPPVDLEGHTPFSFACLQNKQEIVDWMIDNDGDKSAVNKIFQNKDLGAIFSAKGDQA